MKSILPSLAAFSRIDLQVVLVALEVQAILPSLAAFSRIDLQVVLVLSPQ